MKLSDLLKKPLYTAPDRSVLDRVRRDLERHRGPGSRELLDLIVPVGGEDEHPLGRDNEEHIPFGRALRKAVDWTGVPPGVREDLIYQEACFHAYNDEIPLRDYLTDRGVSVPEELLRKTEAEAKAWDKTSREKHLEAEAEAEVERNRSRGFEMER